MTTTKDNVVPFGRKPVYPVRSEAEEDEADIERMVAVAEWRLKNPGVKPRP